MGWFVLHAKEFQLVEEQEEVQEADQTLKKVMLNLNGKWVKNINFYENASGWASERNIKIKIMKANILKLMIVIPMNNVLLEKMN